MKQIKQMVASLLILTMLFAGAGCGKQEVLPTGNDADVQQEQQVAVQPVHDPADDIQPIVTGTVTLSVSCAALMNYLDAYTGDKAALPEGGLLLPAAEVELYENDTVYTLLKRVCTANDLALDVQLMENTVYIAGIGGVSELTAGPMSGWLFAVNGVVPYVDAQSCPLQDGDVVEWHYTLDHGKDITDELES